MSSPIPPSPPKQQRPSTDQSTRPDSSSSDASNSSNYTTLNVSKRPVYTTNNPYPNQPSTRSPSATMPSASNPSAVPPNFSRPAGAFAPQNDGAGRKAPPFAPSHDAHRHRPRQHSQGFFEPSLPTAAMADHASTNMANLTASQIAAQTAMQHQTAAQQNFRNRSQSIPPSQDHSSSARRTGFRESPPPVYTGNQGITAGSKAPSPLYQNGIVGGRTLAATTAANVAFPRSQNPGAPTSPATEHAHETGQKQKSEKSKMKLFSKPKHIGISRDKDLERREKPLPSPNKMGFAGPSGLSRMMNASTTTVNDAPLNNGSMYNLANSSAATVVLADRPSYEKEREKDKEKEKEKEKEKHKHHFLSRQKLKLKDKDDHHHLPLSSASSNSKPLDPSAPQSLYSFTPSSPSVPAFGKSKSGLDLRHGGRALREKKREEKASAAAAAHDNVLREHDHADWTTNGVAVGSSTTLVPSTLGNPNVGMHGDQSLNHALQGFGLQNMAPEDAWDFLKVKLLVLFEGEDVRIALEDLNKLVSIHIQRCVQKYMPFSIVEDLRDLLQTGFSSLDHSLHPIPDDRLVPHLAQMWLFVFGTILPFIQAVFFPLDLEFKGRGSIMTAREAKEFWGALPNGESSNTSIGDELDVRTIVLVSFRDSIILSRYDVLRATFSRLSLDSINANVNNVPPASTSGSSRPSTASALDPGFGSYNSSSSSTLFNGPGSFSSDSAMSRSRAASNTSSNPDNLMFQSSYPSFSPPQNSVLAQSTSQTSSRRGANNMPDPSFLITETVGRMLQCISVLASIQSDDEAQQKIEVLSKELKHNWLGRGRTGRDRRGFVGTRVKPPIPRNDSEETKVWVGSESGKRGSRDSSKRGSESILVNGS